MTTPQLPLPAPLLATLLLSSGALAQESWVLQLPDPGLVLRDLHMQSSQVAWAAGGEGVVRRTLDGGSSWTEFQLPVPSLDAVRFQGSSTGLAAGGGIVRTVNGGVTWNLVDTTGGLRDVAFPTSDLALACGDAGRILRSIDGGQTWSLQSLPTGEDLLAMAFADGTNGLVVGGGGTAFRTEDAGVSWQPLATGVVDDLTSVDLISSSEGFACAGDRVLHTTDLGLGWSTLALPAGFHGNAVDFLLPTHGWVTGDGEWAAYTTDGGQSWTTGLSGGGGALLDVAFVNFTDGLAVGQNGLTYRTGNGGQSWDQVSGGGQDAPPLLEGLCAVDDQNAWAVGGFSTVYRTQDAGANWSEGVIDPQTVYYDIDFHDTQFGVVGGNRQGTFPAWGWTTDGGATWNSDYMFAQFNVHTAEAFGPGQALVAGAGWVVRTTNSWQSLSLISPDPYGTYHGSDSVGNTVWLVGTTFTRSVDGGATWSLLLDPTITYRSVSFVDAQTGWAVGDGGAVLRTMDGGFDWQAVSLPGSAPDLLDVDAISPLEVWISGADGYVLRTTDGGATWVQLDLPTTTVDQWNSIEGFGSGEAWVGGGNFDSGGKVWRRQSGPATCDVFGYCSAKVNSLGATCTLSSSGTPSVTSDDFSVVAQGAIPGQAAVLFYSEAGAANVPLFNATLCLSVPVVRLAVQPVDGTGSVAYPVAVTPALSGLSRWYQLWYRDPLHPDGTGVGLSNALRVTFCD